MNKKYFFLFLLFLLLSIHVFGQKTLSFIYEQQTIDLQKLYLHTDREFYFIGDTLWFQAYLLNGKTNTPISGAINLYVDLINIEGEIIQKALFPISNGLCSGYVSFYRKDLKEGNYLIRAYTDYLKNIGDISFFTKAIKLSKPKNTFGFELSKTPEETSDEIIIDFFPEGGFLLADKLNLVAIKATDNSGKEIDISGKLKDVKGDAISSFRTSYKGMGRFYFIPEKLNSYEVEIDGYPDYKPKFPEIREKGAKLMLINKKEYVNLNIITDNKNQEKVFYIALFHKGEGIFFVDIDASQIHKTIRLKSEFFSNGINRIVLLDSKENPLSERLVFIDKQEHDELTIKFDKREFKTREKVTLHIENRNELTNQDTVHLSMAVVNENALNANGINQNIKSFLLLDSELNGSIPEPNDFFVEDDKFTTQAKLNLLMLTNGWKNYIWNYLKTENPEIRFKPQLGHNFYGKVQTQNKKKIIFNSEVTLGIFSESNIEMYEAFSDLNGNFNFENIQFYDSAVVFLQGRNTRNKPNTNLDLDRSFLISPDVKMESLKSLTNFADIPQSLFRLNYLNELALREYYPDRDTKLLEQINVTGIKPEEKDGHSRLYSDPNHSFKISDNDYFHSNIFEYLAGRAAGVQVQGNQIFIRGISSLSGNNQPLFILDGVPVDQSTVESLSLNNVDKIEILKGANAAIYGMNGGNGVISIFTKKGEYFTATPRPIPGTWIQKIKGFDVFRTFYAPKYASSNIDNKAPDLRTTLYWNPEIRLINGKAQVSFYACDNVSRYKVFLEGISQNGKICLGTSSFEVTNFR